MFKISHAKLLSTSLHQALAKLMAVQGDSTAAVFNLLRTSRKLNKAVQEASELHRALIKNYAVIGEDGNFKMHSSPSPIMPYEIKAECEKEFVGKMEEFLTMEIEIQSNLINLNDFPAFKPTAIDLDALSAVLVPQQEDTPA
jgi:hypothetical protein